mgnify:CR=1 FL=1
MSWSKNVIKSGTQQKAWTLPSREEAESELRRKLAPAVEPAAPAETQKSSAEARAESMAKARLAGYGEGRSEGLQVGREEGFLDGRELGRQQGLDEIRADMEAERRLHSEALRSEAEAFATNIRHFTEQSYEELRRVKEEIVQSHALFALEVARRTVQAELKQTPEAVLAIALNALKELHQGTEFRVLVSPDDFVFLESNRQAILETLTHIRGLEIAPDRTIRGGCMVESESGTIDARIESYLRRMVESVLKEDE